MPKPTNAATVRIDGQLAPYRQRFWLYLLEQRYSPLSAINLVRLLAHLDRWLSNNNHKLSTLNYSICARYILERRNAGYVCWISIRALDPIRSFLVSEGVLKPCSLAPPKDERFAEVLLHYRHWMEVERNLSSTVVASRLSDARAFLLDVFEGDCTMSLSNLNARHLLDFVRTRDRRLSAGTMGVLQSNLRCFLRFLLLQKLIERDLRGALLPVFSIRQKTLPNLLEKNQIEAVLSSCDQRRHRGKRDYAMLLLMLRLGLRVSDVASITLDDIDWQLGQLRVSGKNLREEKLPLPKEVGAAIVGYLKQGRPQTTERALFLTLIAPLRPVVASTISRVTKDACLRAGLPPGSVPRLRHTAASQLLAAGASLDEIAQVLRHRSINTTAIYAKVDQHALSELVRPWPEIGL